MLDEILAAKMANKDLVSVVKTMFNACGTITEALRTGPLRHPGHPPLTLPRPRPRPLTRSSSTLSSSPLHPLPHLSNLPSIRTLPPLP